jgi:S-formylglutathione hydrolase
MMMETLSSQCCFGGTQGFYSHQSESTGTTMRFAVYVPPQAAQRAVPALYYLAGLTCTEETATVKGGAQRLAAEAGLMLVMPDTSPRGAGVAGEEDDWDFGTAAGFYLDATELPWSTNYRMYSYITEELNALVGGHFPVDRDRTGVFGHSMGGHGALTIALKNPDRFRSVSAFAPICAPQACPWGEKAFSNYLGDDRASWAAYDATSLIQSGCRTSAILIDQGEDDQFLDGQLKPHLFEAACEAADQPLTLRRHAGYDHSYYFIASFMADHIAHHAALLDA